MNESATGPELAPEPVPSGAAPLQRRRAGGRFVWRALVASLLAVLLFVLYGGRLGGPSPLKDVRGELLQLRYPSALGSARVRRLGVGFERVQLGGFGEPAQRGPKAALAAALRMTRAGGLLLEVRGLASEAEGDFLLGQAPYACASATETRLLEEVSGIAIRQVQHSLLFRWLPASVSFCGTRREPGLLVHASGFATDGTWAREGTQLRAMLRDLQVETAQLSTAAHGCRLNTGYGVPLYAQFKSEELAQAGVVDKDSVHWIDLPFHGDGGVGRFSPTELDEKASACASAQARFEHLLKEQGDSSASSPVAQEAHHAFRARCEPFFPTLRFFGAATFTPDALPRPLSGWSYRLDASWVPAMCVPAE